MPLSGGGGTMELEYFENLVDFAIAAKKWSFLNQFSEDASNCPDIDAETILPLA